MRCLRIPVLSGLLCGLVATTTARGDETLICVSLQAAEREIRATNEVLDEVSHLCHLTDLIALVVDPASGDLIVVGRREPGAPPLLLEDFALALRLGQRPAGSRPAGVSLELIPDPSDGGSYRVMARFTPRMLRHTHGGMSALRSDVTLKEIGLSVKPTGSPRVPSPAELHKAESRRNRDSDGLGRRQFFYPSAARCLVGDDVVVLDECKMAVMSVFAEGTNPSHGMKDDDPSLIFSRALSENYAEVALVYPELAELQNLMTWICLVKGLDEVEVSPDLSYWLTDYQIPFVEMDEFDDVRITGEAGVVYSQTRQGEVSLRAVAKRIRDGDRRIYARVVLESRPKDRPLSWPVRIVGDEYRKPSDDKDATTWAHLCMAETMLSLRRHRSAEDYVKRALSASPESAEALACLARIRLAEGRPQRALEICSDAVELRPEAPAALRVQVEALLAKRDTVAAVAALSRSIDSDPRSDVDLVRRGEIEMLRGHYEAARADFARAHRLLPQRTSLLTQLGEAHYRAGDAVAAREAWNRSLEVPACDCDRARARLRLDEIEGELGDLAVDRDKPVAVDVRRHLVRLSVGFEYAYDAYQSHSGVYWESGVYSASMPITLTWGYRNRLRIDGKMPFQLVMRPFEISTYWPELRYRQSRTAMGVAAGFDRPRLRSRFLAWASARGTSSISLDVGVFGPRPAEVFEAYVNAEGADFSGVLSMKDPFWFWIAGLEYDTTLTPRMQMTGYAGVRELFGIDPIEHSVGIGEDGFHPGSASRPWAARPDERNWNAGLWLQFSVPGDEQFFSAISVGLHHTRTGTNYSTKKGALEKLPGRSDDRIVLATRIGEGRKVSGLQAGLNFTTNDAGPGEPGRPETQVFVSATLGAERHLIDRWF